MAEKKETAQKPKKASTKATAKAGSTKAPKEEKQPAKKATKKPTMAQMKKVNALVIALSDASRRARVKTHLMSLRSLHKLLLLPLKSTLILLLMHCIGQKHRLVGKCLMRLPI